MTTPGAASSAMGMIARGPVPSSGLPQNLPQHHHPHPPLPLMFNAVNAIPPSGTNTAPNGAPIIDTNGLPPPNRPRRRNRKTLSCLRCHRIKLSCDREKPCHRCKSTGRPETCTYQSDPPKPGPSPSSGSLSKPKVNSRNNSEISLAHNGNRLVRHNPQQQQQQQQQQQPPPPSLPPLPPPPLQQSQHQQPQAPPPPSQQHQHHHQQQQQQQQLHPIPQPPPPPPLIPGLGLVPHPSQLGRPHLPTRIEDPADAEIALLQSKNPAMSAQLQIPRPLPITIPSAMDVDPMPQDVSFPTDEAATTSPAFAELSGAQVDTGQGNPDEETEPPDFGERPDHLLRWRKGQVENVGRSNWTVMSLELLTRYEPEFLLGGKYDVLDKKTKALKHFMPQRRWPNYPFGVPSGTSSLDGPGLIERLASKDLVFSLLDSYFKTINLAYPIEFKCLYIPHVKRILDGEEPLPGPDWQSQFFMMLALGAIVTGSERVEPNVVDDCLLTAQSAFMSTPFMIYPTLQTVRTLILIVIAKMFNVVTFGDEDTIWPLMGYIVRIVNVLSLHRDPEPVSCLSLVEKEIRRRMWWSVVMLDIQVSIEDGRSTFINETIDFDTQPPLNADEDSLCNLSEANQRQDPSSVSTDFAGLHGRTAAPLPEAVTSIILPDHVYTTGSYHTWFAKMAPHACAAIARLNSQVSDLTYETVLAYDTHLRALLRSAVDVILPGGLVNFDANTEQGARRVVEASCIQLLCRRVMLALHQHYICDPERWTKYGTSYWTVLDYSIALLSHHQAAEAFMTGVQTMNVAPDEPEVETPTTSWFSRLFFRTIYTATLHVGLGLRRGDFTSRGLPQNMARSSTPGETAWNLLKNARLMHEQIASISLEHFKSLRALALGSAAVDAAIHGLDPYQTVLAAARRVIQAIVNGRNVDWNHPLVRKVWEELDQGVDDLVSPPSLNNGMSAVSTPGVDPSPESGAEGRPSAALRRPTTDASTSGWILNFSRSGTKPLLPPAHSLSSSDKDSSLPPMSSLRVATSSISGASRGPGSDDLSTAVTNLPSSTIASGAHPFLPSISTGAAPLLDTSVWSGGTAGSPGFSSTKSSHQPLQLPLSVNIPHKISAANEFSAPASLAGPGSNGYPLARASFAGMAATSPDSALSLPMLSACAVPGSSTEFPFPVIRSDRHSLPSIFPPHSKSQAIQLLDFANGDDASPSTTLAAIATAQSTQPVFHGVGFGSPSGQSGLLSIQKVESSNQNQAGAQQPPSSLDHRNSTASHTSTLPTPTTMNSTTSSNSGIPPSALAVTQSTFNFALDGSNAHSPTEVPASLLNSGQADGRGSSSYSNRQMQHHSSHPPGSAFDFSQQVRQQTQQFPNVSHVGSMVNNEYVPSQH